MTRFFLAFCLLSSTAWAQLPEASWYFSAGSTSNRGAASLLLDNGDMLYTGTYRQLSEDVFLARIDSEGNRLWEKNLGLNDDEFVNNMIFLNSSTVIICGDVIDGSGNMDGFLLAADTSGAVQWRSTFGIEERNEDFYSLTTDTNGDILVAGFVTAAAGSGNDILVAKYDITGNQLWRTTWGSEVNDYAMGICTSPGGRIFVSADRWIEGTGYNTIVFELSADGMVTGEFPVTLPYNSGCKNLIINSAGKLILTGESATEAGPAFDILLVQIDTLGTVDWVQWIGDVAGSEAGYDVAEAADGSYLITGFGYNAIAENSDIFVVHVDMEGLELNRQYFGGANVDYAYDIHTDAAGNYWVSGFSNTGDTSNFALIRGVVDLTLSVAPENAPSISIYPNPARDAAHVTIDNALTASVSCYTLSGNLVKVWHTGGLAPTIALDGMAKGMYMLCFYAASGQLIGTQRLVVK